MFKISLGLGSRVQDLCLKVCYRRFGKYGLIKGSWDLVKVNEVTITELLS